MDEDLHDRVAALEERLAELERAEADATAGAPSSARPDVTAPPPTTFWALEGLKTQLPPDGGAVLFTGTVPLPSGERYDWQQAHPSGELLDLDWHELVDALSALAHPARLTILRAALAGVRTVAELAELDGLGTTGQVYHHARQLVAAGWLQAAERGRYAVPGTRVVPLLTILAAARR